MMHLLPADSRLVALFAALLFACGGPPAAPEVAGADEENTPALPEPRDRGAREAAPGLSAPAPVLPDSAVVSERGVAWHRVAVGRGASPGPHDAVRLHYTGWDRSGAVFASTQGRGRAATFRLHELIPGLEEALSQMKPGERRWIRVPAAQAFDGQPGMPRGEVVYDLELLEVLSAPAAPADVGAPPPSAVTSSSGLVQRSLSPGTGAVSPALDDVVRVDFSAWSLAGDLLDSTALRAHPTTLAVSRTMPGMAEALQTMVEGERRRLWIPEDLAYQGRSGAPAGTLVVDLALLELLDPPAAPPLEPPRGALVGASGLSSLVLVAGEGERRPGPDSLVTLHFTGWTAAGELHDSSLGRGQPSTVRVSDLIPGWREGLQLMVEGETRRLWLPESLAFAGQADKPGGPMVYDLELLAVTDG
jgi:FKBP-type peptidyl-prolyl cis-trans isomerase